MRHLGSCSRPNLLSLPLYALVLSAAILFSSPATSQVFVPFAIDPARSTIGFDSGDASARFGQSVFAFSNLQAQPGTAPVPLSGHFLVQAVPDLASATDLAILVGTSDVRAEDAVAISPAVGALPGTSPGAIGVSLSDPSAGFEADLALRELIFALSANLIVMPNGVGPQGLFGSMAWQHVSGQWEMVSDMGLEGSLPVGSVTSFNGGVFSSTSQLEQVSPDVWELTLPYSFTLVDFALPGPVSDSSGSMTFSGEIVATTDVPEPGFLLGIMLGCAAMIGIGRRGARR